MDNRKVTARSLLIPLIAIAGVGLGACASPEPRHSRHESERVYRDSDEVCRQRVVTEQRRDRDGDRTRVAKSETTCRER